MKEKKLEEVIFSFEQLRGVANYSNRSIDRLYNDLDLVYKKMLELNLKYEDERYIKRFVLFNRYIIDKDKRIVKIKASEDFEYILNNLIGNFTSFELIEFVKLKSVYSKNLFKILKQWQTVKEKKFTIEEFRELLAVPKSYTTADFNRRVLTPIVQELPNYFHNLKLEKIKTKTKVTHLKFTWEREQKVIEQKQVETVISKKLESAIELAKKNSFIKHLMTTENIVTLLKEFSDDDLTKGLNNAYKEIQWEVHNLSYIIKNIQTYLSKPVTTFKVKEEKNINVIKNEYHNEYGAVRPINFEENSEEEVIEKEKITKEEYEELYKEFLKENNSENSIWARKGFDKKNKNKYEITDEKITKSSYTNIQEQTEESHIIDITEPKKEEKNENDDNDMQQPPSAPEDEFSDEKEIKYPSFEECSPETQKRMLLLKKSEEAKKVFDKFMQNMYMFKREINLYITQNNLSIFEKHKYKKMFEKIEKYIAIMSKFIVNLDYSLDLATEIDEVKIVDIFNYVNDLLKEYDLENDIVKFEDIQKMINLKVAVEDSHKLTKSVKKNIDLLNFEDIPKDKLLSKKGTQLSGGALIAKLEKIARDEKIKIDYKGKIIPC